MIEFKGCKREGKLVKIEWLDSVHPTSQWERLSNYEPFEAFKCVSVGFLVSDGDITKGLAQSIADRHDSEKSGIVHIPVCSITKITDLTTSV